MASEISEIDNAFGQQLNAFMAVRILLKYFRRRLLQFKGSKMSPFFLLTSWVALLFLQELYILHYKFQA